MQIFVAWPYLSHLVIEARCAAYCRIKILLYLCTQAGCSLFSTITKYIFYLIRYDAIRHIYVRSIADEMCRLI